MPITIESNELILERVGDDSFKVTLGDLDMGDTPDKVYVRVGDSIRIPIPSMLVMTSGGKRKVTKITEVYV